MGRGRNLTQKEIDTIIEYSATMKVKDLAKKINNTEYMVLLTCRKLHLKYITNTGRLHKDGRELNEHTVDRDSMPKGLYKHLTQEIKKPKGLWG